MRISQFSIRYSNPMYGFKRTEDEMEPFLKDINSVRINHSNAVNFGLKLMYRYARERGDVNHFLDPNMAFMRYGIRKKGSIINLYDAIMISYYSANNPRAVINDPMYREFDRVVTISETSKKAIVEWYGIDEDRVRVVPCGVNTNRFYQFNTPKWSTDGMISMLYVGNSSRHKNVEFLIKLLCHDRNLHLFHVGVPADMRLVDLANSLGVGTRYCQMGYVENLTYMYNAVDYVVSASLDEGFNLPPLEGLACRTPCILSDIPVHREIYGNSAMLLPLEYEAWKDVLDSDHIKFGNTIVEKYTWENAANKLMEVYNEFH